MGVVDRISNKFALFSNIPTLFLGQNLEYKIANISEKSVKQPHLKVVLYAYEPAPSHQTSAGGHGPWHKAVQSTY